MNCYYNFQNKRIYKIILLLLQMWMDYFRKQDFKMKEFMNSMEILIISNVMNVNRYFNGKVKYINKIYKIMKITFSDNT